LHAGSGDIHADEVAAAGDFVDFVDIDDTVLGQINIIVGFAHEVPYKVFHIPPDVTGLAEFGGITLDKGHSYFLSDELNHVGFADAGGPDHQDVVLDTAHHLVDGFRRIRRPLNTVKMGTNFGGQDLFGPILLDDVLIQVVDQRFGGEIEIDSLLGLGRCFPIRGRIGLGQHHWRDHPHRATILLG